MVADYVSNTRRTRNGYPRSGYKYNRRSRTDRHRRATAISAKIVKNALSATQNNELEDLCQNTQNESREGGKSTETPKNQTDMTSSSTGTTTSGQEYIKFLPDNPYIVQTHQDSHTIPKSDTQLMVSPQHVANKIEEPGLLSKEDFFGITVVLVFHEEDQQKLDICKTQSNATVEEDNDKEKFDEEKWDYDKIIEAFQNIEQLKKLIQHKLTTLPIAYPIPDAI
ncbi:28189_t:CDS:2 [Gigaspora margarita]|uniref:28189_t:CDS:1 n=1 Tax=Gigaspora margarita TaxID=4874 RepID=A0ABN7VBG1_GIGMA|nr:28189_t:CDS:2 [Gigaspora margarita]